MRILMDDAGAPDAGDVCHVDGCRRPADLIARIVDKDSLPMQTFANPLTTVAICDQHMFDLQNFGDVTVEGRPGAPRNQGETWLRVNPPSEAESDPAQGSDANGSGS